MNTLGTQNSAKFTSNESAKISAQRIMGDCLLNRETVGAALGMSPEAVSVAMYRGSFPIPCIRIGRRVRFRASDVQEFLRTGQQAPALAAIQ